jgi:hypothetical protein
VRSAIVRTTKMIVTVRIGGTGVTKAKKTTRNASASGSESVDTVVIVRSESASARGLEVEAEVAGRMTVIGRDVTDTDMTMRPRRSARRGDAAGRRGS